MFSSRENLIRPILDAFADFGKIGFRQAPRTDGIALMRCYLQFGGKPRFKVFSRDFKLRFL